MKRVGTFLWIALGVVLCLWISYLLAGAGEPSNLWLWQQFGFYR